MLSSPSTKLNCWEVMHCGREPGGTACARLGACPATTDGTVDGINGGRNGGRLCWAVAGTFCGGRVQSCQALARHTCMACRFFAEVLDEEGPEAVMSRPDQVEWLGRS